MAASRYGFHVLVAALLAPGAIACLPQDTRPTPASLLVTASSNDAVQNGFDTDDGWHVEFRKFLVSIGRASFGEGSGSCTPYSDTGYQRVLDMLRPEEQKVGLIYGLGSCELEFRVAYPTVGNSVTGAGVSADELLYMQTQGSDRFATTGVGVNGYVAGTARKQSQTVTFDWSFRQNWSYAGCSELADAGVPSGIEMPGHASVSVNLTVHGDELFQNEDPSGQSRLQFEPIARADSQLGNQDGDVSLDELASVPVRAVPLVDSASDPNSIADGNTVGGDAGAPMGNKNSPDNSASDLEALVYLVRYPAMFHYGDSGQCQMTVSRRGRGRD